MTDLNSEVSLYSVTGQDPNSNDVFLVMLDVYRQALLFQMKRLEHLCVEYFKACVSHRNVLVVLQSAARLKLEFIKVLILCVVSSINFLYHLSEDVGIALQYSFIH